MKRVVVPTYRPTNSATNSIYLMLSIFQAVYVRDEHINFMLRNPNIHKTAYYTTRVVPLIHISLAHEITELN